MFSTVTAKITTTTATTTTITAQAELAAFSSDSGCPTPAAVGSTEPVDPRYAHSAALGCRRQAFSHKRARRCQECTRPLTTACTSRYCTECDPSVRSGDLWSAQDTAAAVEAPSDGDKNGLQQQEQPQQKDESPELQLPGVHLWGDEDSGCAREDPLPAVPVPTAAAATAAAAAEIDESEVPDEWDAEED